MMTNMSKLVDNVCLWWKKLNFHFWNSLFSGIALQNCEITKEFLSQGFLGLPSPWFRLWSIQRQKLCCLQRDFLTRMYWNKDNGEASRENPAKCQFRVSTEESAQKQINISQTDRGSSQHYQAKSRCLQRPLWGKKSFRTNYGTA